MELPAQLRAAVDRLLEGVPLADLRQASALLSSRYRGEVRDGRLHLDAELAVKAYLAARLPATFAAVRAALAMVDEAIPDFQPRTLLDIGAGPGTALWASQDAWPGLDTACMVEASDPVRRVGTQLCEALPGIAARWKAGDVTRPLENLETADLVTLCYVLDELPPAGIASLTDKLWSLSSQMLVIVEPGTPAGWRRILQVRERLIALGASIIAPCPHEKPCPLVAPDWCHFSRRVARSRVHRLTKGADVPWEDEKFIFLAASREPPGQRQPRILAPSKLTKAWIDLKLCSPDGQCAQTRIAKREGEAFRAAKKLDWGDLLT